MMKRFNLKTLVIGLLILIGLLVIVFTTFGQNPQEIILQDISTDLLDKYVN